MATTSDSSVSFDEGDTRREEMHSTIEAWIKDLVAAVDEAGPASNSGTGSTSSDGFTTTRIATPC